jgi:hypothetical protein
VSLDVLLSRGSQFKQSWRQRGQRIIKRHAPT